MSTMQKIFKLTTILLVLLVAGCTLDDPDSPTGLTPPEGDEVFENYVALGNSLTSGFMDGGLMIAGQMSSFPRLISGQIGLANMPGEFGFSQPWIDGPGIGSADAPSGATHAAGVYFFDKGTGSLGILGETALADVSTTLLLAATQPTPYHNLGVPGAALADVMNAYSSTTAASFVNFASPNPYFDFINRYSLFGNLSVPATATTPSYETCSMFGQGVMKGPTLVTMWIGNNDVLGGATSGTIVPGVTITDVVTFDEDYKAMLAMLAGGLIQRTGWPATIVVANIPEIADIPYFWDRDTEFLPAIGGAWPAGFEEEIAGGTVELVRFTAAQWVATANPMADPIPANYTLTTTEVAAVDAAVAAYNLSIAEAVAGVNALGLAQCGLVDANSIMAGLAAPQKTHFLLVIGQLLAGGMPMNDAIDAAEATTLFSLDGIHPNNLGYAVLANAFVDEIESLTGATLGDVPAQVWDATYGHPGTVPGKTASVIDPGIDGAMERLFR